MWVKIAMLGIAVSAVSTASEGKERGLDPLPCPLQGVLRVPDSGSLHGIETLSGCAAQVIVAPATPADYVEPRTQSIIPQADERTPRRLIVADRSQVRLRKVAAPAVAPLSSNVGAIATPEAILRLRPARYATPHDGVITRVAERYRIDPLFLHAVIGQESSYRVDATSSAGARGLMQLMPGTARMLGIGGHAIAHPEVNVDGGARLLRRLYGRYNGDFALTLAAYNAGEGAVARYGNRIPPFAETQNYVRAVFARYQRLAADQGLIGR